MSSSLSRSSRIAWPPLVAVAGVGAIILLALWPVAPSPDTSTVVASRELRFIEQPGDRMAIVDAKTGVQVAAVRSTADGFVPGVMYGMEVARRRYSVDLNAPYRLTQLSNGRVLLTDPPTHNEIDLESFGSGNAATFAALLHIPEADGRQGTR